MFNVHSVKIKLTLVRYSQCNQQTSCPSFFQSKLPNHPE